MLPWRWLNRALAVPEHCEPQNKLLLNLSSSFDTCIPTNLALLSTILGSLSILAWLFAQVPQIYKNWKLKSTARLSIYFLVEWCLGDTANLIGAILTKQATWQVTVAAYYTFVDCVLVSQFIYFTYFLKTNLAIEDIKSLPRSPGPDSSDSALQRPTKSSDSKPRPTPPRAVNRSRDPIFDAFRFPAASPSPREKTFTPSSRPITIRNTTSATAAPSPKTILLISLLLALSHTQASPLPSPLSSSSTTTGETIGQLISWLSTLLYLGSRLPQILKNHRRRSTSGLSPSLFIAAFTGNFFYSTSLLTNPLAWATYGPYGGHGWASPEGSERGRWVALATPFFLGAAGVLGLDGCVGVQFLLYGEGEGATGNGRPGEGRGKAVPVVDEAGKTHWRKVSGWMRGWVPSPRLGPRRVESFVSFGGLDGGGEVEGEREREVGGRGDQRPLLSRDSYEDRAEEGGGRSGYGTTG